LGRDLIKEKREIRKEKRGKEKLEKRKEKRKKEDGKLDEGKEGKMTFVINIEVKSTLRAV